jgi:hypothetical protein
LRIAHPGALEHFHPDGAGCKRSNSLFDRMIHAL